MAALKRKIDLSREDIQEAWQEVRNDAANTNWYIFELKNDRKKANSIS